MKSINHLAIKERLIEAGFSQPVKNKFACWVNLNSVVVYYAANNGANPIYAVCYKDSRWEFSEVKEFNKILGTVNQKINHQNNEIIHNYAPEDLRT